MMEMISESADMNLKDFIKNLGLELDEDYGVDLTKMRLAWLNDQCYLWTIKICMTKKMK